MTDPAAAGTAPESAAPASGSRTPTSTPAQTLEMPPRLRSFHITFYAIVLGMAGFALAVQRVGGRGDEGMLPALQSVSTVLLSLTLLLFAAVTVFYVAKIVRYPQTLAKEFNHPIKINFFPLIAKILLVLSIAFLDRSMAASLYLWIIGTLLQFVAALVIISVWIRHTQFKIEHMTPAWFIPIVGCLIVPIAGVPHGFFEVSWFFFAVGLVFWLALFTIVLYRMFFHAPIPDRLLPTLFILFAPPAIAVISYIRLEGLTAETGIDAFVRILYNFSLFLLMLVLLKVGILARLKFFLSWWAYSFPLAAKTLATVLMWQMTGNPFYYTLALTELVLLTLVIILLLIVTTRAILRAEICVED
ncbi:MAG: SLAC1 anion channel family protein [Phycisphaeraceae bacterium]|nr:SLAC1 anion channel family protein [Phycisphaeraceae bacterium]